MLTTSAIYISLSGLLILVLASTSFRPRLSKKIGLGDAGNKDLMVAMRCQANNAEYMPITLLLLAVAEVNGASHILLHIAGVTFVAARAWHAWGFMRSNGLMSAGRYYGTLINFSIIIFLAAINMLLAFKLI